MVEKLNLWSDEGVNAENISLPNTPQCLVHGHAWFYANNHRTGVEHFMRL